MRQAALSIALRQMRSGLIRSAVVAVAVVAMVVWALPAGGSIRDAHLVLQPGTTAARVVVSPDPLDHQVLEVSGVIEERPQAGPTKGWLICFDAFYSIADPTGKACPDFGKAGVTDSILIAPKGCANQVGCGADHLHHFATAVVQAGRQTPDYPPLESDHKYLLILKAPGMAQFWAQPFGQTTATTQWSGHFELGLGTGVNTTPPTTTVAGKQKATVGSFTGDVSIRKHGGSFEDANAGDTLEEGDDISTGPDTYVTVRFSDGSTVELLPGTQANIGSLLRQQNDVRVRVNLMIGKLEAKIAKSQTSIPSFSIKTPNATASVRGTAFSVFYDPGWRASVVAVTQHSVDVAPASGGKAVTVTAGHEVEVTGGVSPAAPLGKANPHGGIDRALAFRVAQAAVGKAKTACGLGVVTSPSGFATRPSGDSWLVTLQVVGAVHGGTTWQVVGNTATPVNALAKKLAAGCASTAPTTTTTGTTTPAASVPDLTGTWTGTQFTNLTITVAKPGLKTLHATWVGGPGHSGLKGSLDATLSQSGGVSTYSGPMTVDEGSVHVTGTMTLRVVDANNLVLSYTQSNGPHAENIAMHRSG